MEGTMSNLRPDDEQNGSFGAVTGSSQDAKPGVAPAATADEEGGAPRRRPGKIPYAGVPLAERIRDQEKR
jgi:hypothetical protein